MARGAWALVRLSSLMAVCSTTLTSTKLMNCNRNQAAGGIKPFPRSPPVTSCQQQASQPPHSRCLHHIPLLILHMPLTISPIIALPVLTPGAMELLPSALEPEFGTVAKRKDEPRMAPTICTVTQKNKALLQERIHLSVTNPQHAML
jgi:hypothetical protein